MKKIAVLLLPMFFIMASMSCGGTSSSTPRVTRTYRGAMGGGDYAQFILSGSSLSYSVTGFYFPSGTSGSLDVTQVSISGSTTPFYYYTGDSETEIGYGFLGANLGYAGMDGIDSFTDSEYLVGLVTGTVPTADTVVGNYVGSTSWGQLVKWTFASATNTGNTYTISTIQGTEIDEGCWRINSSTYVLDAWSSNSCASVTPPSSFDYSIYIKPATTGLNAFVVDYKDGSGVAAGLEQSVISITGNKTFYLMCTDGANKMKATFTPPSGGSDPTWELFLNNGDAWDSIGTGSVELNQDCSDQSFNGSSCATLTDGTESGLYMDIFLGLTKGYFIAWYSSIASMCFGGTN